MERKNAWLSYGESDEKEMEKLAKDYRAFLDAGKTERECVTELVREAEANGYVSLEAKQAAGEKIQPGDKVYAVGMKKIMALFHVGQEPLEKGMNILGAHIDSPRLDVKQNPLYEDTDLAYLDTHYYGGVKKYQWVALPLAIHGVIAKKDGSVVNVTIGEDENDPVVYITDLLIHLAGKQLQKKAAEVIEGENLDILIGSKNARNKNVLVVGGSGSGKTRFWLKPNLLQCHSSYVVTDPNGGSAINLLLALVTLWPPKPTVPAGPTLTRFWKTP